MRLKKYITVFILALLSSIVTHIIEDKLSNENKEDQTILQENWEEEMRDLIIRP